MRASPLAQRRFLLDLNICRQSTPTTRSCARWVSSARSRRRPSRQRTFRTAGRISWARVSWLSAPTSGKLSCPRYETGGTDSPVRRAGATVSQRPPRASTHAAQERSRIDPSALPSSTARSVARSRRLIRSGTTKAPAPRRRPSSSPSTLFRAARLAAPTEGPCVLSLPPQKLAQMLRSACGDSLEVLATRKPRSSRRRCSRRRRPRSSTRSRLCVATHITLSLLPHRTSTDHLGAGALCHFTSRTPRSRRFRPSSSRLLPFLRRRHVCGATTEASTRRADRRCSLDVVF